LCLPVYYALNAENINEISEVIHDAMKP